MKRIFEKHIKTFDTFRAGANYDYFPTASRTVFKICSQCYLEFQLGKQHIGVLLNCLTDLLHISVCPLW